jgi:hypothetical protein
MESTAAIHTVFAIVVRNLQFSVPYTLAIAFIVVCAGAWILTVIDIRRPNKLNANSLPPTEEEIDREFARLVRRR